MLKDPIAFFSTEWIYRRYNAHIVITVRHPAAFASSLKLKNWRFDFRNLAEQTALVEKHLPEYGDRIADAANSSPDSIIDQACLIWNIIHSTIAQWKRANPDWIVLRHEDLSLNPNGEFKELFEELDIPFTSQVNSYIDDTSGSQNPSEQTPGNEFKRDSKANIKNWQTRLSKSEIDSIRQETSEVSASFYDDSDWN